MTDQSLASPPLAAEPARLGILRALARGGSAALLMRLASMIMMLVFQVVLTRSLGLARYGEFSIVLGWAMTLGFVATLGMDRAALRFVAHYRTTAEAGLLRGFLQRAWQAGGVGAGVPMVLMMLAALFRYQGSSTLFAGLLLGALIIPLLAQAWIADAALLAMDRVWQGLVSSVLRPLLVVVLMLAATRLLHWNATTPGALLIYVVSCMLTWLVVLWLVQDWLAHHCAPSVAQFQTRLWVRAAFPLMLVVLLNYLQNQSGILLSGMLLGPREAGLFSAASRISEALLIGFSSINAVAAPTFAAMHARGDRAGLQHYVRLCAWASTAVTLLAALPFVLLGRPFMGIFGAEFVDAYPILLVLLLNPLIMSVAGSVNYLLNMTGYQDLCLWVFGGTTLAYFGLCFLLVPWWGVLGIAWANVLTTLAWNVVLLHLVRSRLGIWSSIGLLGERWGLARPG